MTLGVLYGDSSLLPNPGASVCGSLYSLTAYLLLRQKSEESTAYMREALSDIILKIINEESSSHFANFLCFRHPCLLSGHHRKSICVEL